MQPSQPPRPLSPGERLFHFGFGPERRSGSAITPPAQSLDSRFSSYDGDVPGAPGPRATAFRRVPPGFSGPSALIQASMGTPSHAPAFMPMPQHPTPLASPTPFGDRDFVQQASSEEPATRVHAVAMGPRAQVQTQDGVHGISMLAQMHAMIGSQAVILENRKQQAEADKKQISELQQALAQAAEVLKTERTKHAKEKKGLQAQVTAITAEIKGLQAEFTDMTATIERLEHTAKKREAIIQRKDKSITSLLTKLRAARSQKAD